MTPRQTGILAFVRAFKARNGHCPTYREIGAGLKISAVAVHSHVQALVRLREIVGTNPMRLPEDEGPFLNRTQHELFRLFADNPGITQAEAARRLGISCPSVYDRLRDLETMGAVRMSDGKVSVVSA